VKTSTAIMISAIAIVAACGKSDPGLPNKSPSSPPPITIDDVKPALPVAPLPEIRSADPTPGPLPGQANDHSSPDFKRGGTAAKK